MRIEPLGAPAAGLGRLGGTAGIAERRLPGDLTEAAREFEAIFIEKAFQTMRRTTLESGLFSSQGEKLFREMLDQEFAREAARSGRIGISEVLMSQLSIRERSPETAIDGEVKR